MMLDRRLIKNFPYIPFLITLSICTIGLVNLYSACYPNELIVFKKQVMWVAIGTIGMIVMSSIDYKIIKRYTTHIYLVSTLMLILVLILGKEISGSKSWLSLGRLSIQPSEFAKLSTILVIARFYEYGFQKEPYGLSDLVKPFIFIAIPASLIMLQPDLGTVLMILAIAGSMILFMGIRTKSLVILALLLLGLPYPSWKFFLKDYQKERIKTFLNPYHDPLGAGYNSIQSQIAVGSGKLWGKSFKKGSQTQLRFIPAQKTDFLFSVLAEEWGFIGGFFTLLLYFLIIMWILDTSSRAKDIFSSLVSLGIASMFFWHTFINVGMVIGILPVMGIPLLLFSYGGSSLITSMLGIGLVLGIRMRKLPVLNEEMEIKCIS